jgi:hypothetical protein
MAALGGWSAKLCAQPLRGHARPVRLCSANYPPPTSSLAPLFLADWPRQRRCWPLRPATITTDAARTPLAAGSASYCKAHAGVADAAEAVRPGLPHARVFARPAAAQPVLKVFFPTAPAQAAQGDEQPGGHVRPGGTAGVCAWVPGGALVSGAAARAAPGHPALLGALADPARAQGGLPCYSSLAGVLRAGARADPASGLVILPAGSSGCG